METWFLNHVLGLSLAVLLLGLPPPLRAGTPGNNSTDSVTVGFDYSTATDEVSDVENNATSTSYSSESLSPSQRNILLTHTAETHTAAAGNFDTEQTQTFTETSSRSLEAISLSTEPLTSTLVIATTEASISSSTSGSSSTGGSSSSSSTSGSSSTGSSSSSSSSTSGSSSTGSSSSSGSSTSGSSSSSSSTSGISGTRGISGSSGHSTSGTSGSSSSNTSDISGSSSSTSGISGTRGISGSSSSSSSTSGFSGSSSSSISGSSSSSGGSSSSTSGFSGSSSSSSSSSSTSGSSSSISSSTGGSGSSSSSQGWKGFVNTDQVPDVTSALFLETSSLMLTDETRLPQDSPDTTLQQGDASSSMSHTALHTDSTYTSTTITRAGERTLLSFTSSSSNSTSSVFTEDSNSKATETEDYTHSALSTRADSRDTTDQHMTSSFKGTFPETGSPGGPRGTHSLTRQPNGTSNQHTSTSEETSDSTPPLRVTEPSTDQSEVPFSSTPPITSPAEGPTNISGTDQGSGSSVGTSTESSTGVLSLSTENQEGTEVVSSQTSEQSVSFGLTTGPPTVSSSTSGLDNYLTDTTALITEVFPTSTPVTVTERSHITEENTFKATASTPPPTTTTTTTTTPSPLPATSSSRFTSAASSSAPGSPTQATILYTTPPTTASSTAALQTSTMRPTHRASPSQTQGPSTGMANPTNATTLQAETSTSAHGITTSQRQHVTTTYTRSTPTKSPEVQQTTRNQTDRGTTELVVTTSPTDFRSTKVPPLPENPCVSNPCMNGGMCVSYKTHQYTCQCQQAWTGPTCNQDMDECENDPCPVGSKCVNRRGSFSCECPLGFDLEDGRTCTRAKTFLGTFSVKKQPHDPIIFKSTTMHEIQREIILLLNASLSALGGYSRSLLSKKGEDGLRISAVNMFSTSTEVTSAEVYNSIQMSLSNCSSSLAHCRMVLHHQLDYRMESLCVAQKTQCDTERSTCTDDSGTAHCQCLQGYYKHNPEDQSCLECGDGYKLENGTCVPCMFGFGGFNCGNFYKLIAVVVSPAGGALLLILVIALIVTCCKKDKNDINKIIFKSGDLQMSPYADFAKNNRISMEWGRETIEMQENGSTKNLLQMTDIYYSPALRNSDLERNGLYPFTGLPGSRHSCIYPAQWNPSFISDDSRRRDYF